MARVRTHPGEVLREEYLGPLGMSAHQLAEAIDVPPNRISEIAREARAVTADTAIRLAEYFDTTPEFWMNLQTAHDLSKAAAAVPARQYFPSKVTAAPTKLRSEKTSLNIASFAAKAMTKGGGSDAAASKARAASVLSQREAKTGKYSMKDSSLSQKGGSKKK